VYSLEGFEGQLFAPCKASIEYDGKLDDTNAIFGIYDVKMGARIYASDTDTAPLSLPEQEFTVTFEMPVTDLSTLYEEDVSEEKSETVEYLNEKFRAKV